jgi:6-phosphogluconolactonase
MSRVDIFPDAAGLARAAADLFVARAGDAIAARGRFAVALAGGSTPRLTYERLATAEYAAHVDWERVDVFWGDERCVPPDDPASNYRLARETLFAQAPIPAENIHRIRGEAAPEVAADEYEELLRDYFRQRDARFDLAFLGLGEDGHTASLFPGAPALREGQRWVLAQHVEELRQWRVTLTPAALNAAACVAFLVSGAGKAERLRQILAGPHQPKALPAQLIRPVHGEVRWLVDAEAAARLQ